MSRLEAICENCHKYPATHGRSRARKDRPNQFVHGPLCDGCWVMLQIARNNCPMRELPTAEQLEEMLTQEVAYLRIACDTRHRSYRLMSECDAWWFRVIPTHHRGRRWRNYPPPVMVPELVFLGAALRRVYARRCDAVRALEDNIDRLRHYREQLETNPLQLGGDLEDPDFMHRVVTRPLPPA